MNAQTLVARLEQGFHRIQHKRMQGLPMLNPALAVECVGFRPWPADSDQGYLGVLITPWFMSLVGLPCEADQWPDKRVGDKLTLAFPSGSYEFILGDEPGIGRYLSCSLFSPVFEFDSQQAAVATAEAVMTGLMDEDNREPLSMREREIERIWLGDQPEPDFPSDQELLETPSLEDRLEQPLSRRDLLRGRVLGHGDAAERG